MVTVLLNEPLSPPVAIQKVKLGFKPIYCPSDMYLPIFSPGNSSSPVFAIFRTEFIEEAVGEVKRAINYRYLVAKFAMAETSFRFICGWEHVAAPFVVEGIPL